MLDSLAGLALLALPLAVQETAQVEREAGLHARGLAFWDARVKEGHAAQYDLLAPKVQRQPSLTNSVQGQGPLQYLAARIEAVQTDEAKRVLTCAPWSASDTP